MPKNQRSKRRRGRGAVRRTKKRNARRRSAWRTTKRNARRRAAWRTKRRNERRRAARRQQLADKWLSYHCVGLNIPGLDDDYEFPWHVMFRCAVREAMPQWLRNVSRKLDDALWWFRHRLDPRRRFHVVPTGLRPGYLDPDIRILHASFELFRQWYEYMSSMICWDDPELPPDYATLRELYVWWTKERAEETAAVDAVMERAPNPIELQEQGIPHDPRESVALLALRERLESKDDIQLARLAMLRRHLEYP